MKNMKNLILKKLHLGKAILFVFMLMSWISFGQEVCNVPDQWDYVTIADGDWDSNSTWENGLIPDDGATKIKDKNILITHHITRTDSNIDTEDVILHIDGGSLVLNRAFNPGRESMIILENAHLEVTNGKKIQLKGQTTLCSINSCIIADSAIDINYGDVHIVNSGLISRNNEIQFSREITVTGSDMRFWADDYIEVSNSNINWDFENTVSAWYSRAKSSWEGSGKPDMNLLPPMEDASYDACEQAFEGDLCVYQDCNDNTYLNSDDPNTIEYDNIIGLYHSTMIKEIDGTVKVWGASSSPTSSAVTSPIAVTPENGYHYDGEILKMAAGAGSGSNVQFAILTT